MKTKTSPLKVAVKPAEKRTYRTLDEAVRTKSKEMERLFADADWSTLKRPKS